MEARAGTTTRYRVRFSDLFLPKFVIDQLRRMIQATIYLVNKVARASRSWALMSLSNQVVIDIDQDQLSIIKKILKDFTQVI